MFEANLSPEMIAFLAAVVATVVELLKQKWGVEGWRLTAYTLAASIVLGGLYALLKETGYLPAVWAVFSAACVIYAVIVKYARPLYETKQ